MKRIVVAALIGALMAAGLVLAGCTPIEEFCPGNAECTVTIAQGPSGLYIDNAAPRSTCGKRKTYNSDTETYTGGCKVENMITYSSDRRYGIQSCDCE